MDEELATNLAWWEERAKLHADTPMYRPAIEGLHRGEPALFSIERELMGDVGDLDVLHVPCHIGHDTLSWALLGARVTGVDFSPAALAEAARLTASLGLDATWVQADAQALPHDLDGRFDRVVSTYGAYGWMRDLTAWIEGIARCLRPGGRFILVDGHPVFLSLSDHDGKLVLAEPAMGGGLVTDVRCGSYADETLTTTHNVEHGWCHGIGELVTALLDAGLVIDHLAEHDWCVWRGVPTMVPRPEGGFQFPPPLHGTIPCMLSIAVHKPVQ